MALISVKTESHCKNLMHFGKKMIILQTPLDIILQPYPMDQSLDFNF